MDGLGLHPAPATRSPLSARAFGPEVLLGELIGRGGMSRVYRGWLRSNGAEVAVKVLRDDLASHPESVRKFVRERDLLAAVASPHVVRVHDLVVHGDEFGIVMDLVPGGHLRRAVTFPCAPLTAAELTVQIADGLAAVHALGVVHRDLKPENVLVDGDGADGVLLRLTDFGISRLLDAATMTQTSVTGTPGYLAPEIASGGKITAAADVYALGVVLYELCTGRGPFLADNPLVLLLAHTRQEPPRPGGMPDPLWALLAAMLAKEPTARPSAAQVSAALRGMLPLLGGVPECTPPPPAPPPLETAAPATLASPFAAVPGTAPPTGQVGAMPTGPVGAMPTGRVGALPTGPMGAMPTGQVGALPTGQVGVPGARLPSRRDRGATPPGAYAGPWTVGPAEPPRSGGLSDLRRMLERPPAMVAAAVAAVLLVVLAGIGVRAAFMEPGAATLEPVPTVSSAPDPTGPAPTAPVIGPTTPQAPPHTIVGQPTPTGASSPQGSVPHASSTSAAPTPTFSPDVPTIARREPTTAELHSTDGQLTFTIGRISPKTGTVASIAVGYDGKEQAVPVRPGAVEDYEATVDGLEIGREYSFTVKVCNSAKLCTTSDPFVFTPYGAPEVRKPKLAVNGQEVVVTVRSVDRNSNPGETRCTLSVSPDDPGTPQQVDVSPDGDSKTFTGRPGTKYTATESCATEDVPDGQATSASVTTALPPTPTPSPSASTSTPPPATSTTTPATVASAR